MELAEIHVGAHAPAVIESKDLEDVALDGEPLLVDSGRTQIDDHEVEPEGGPREQSSGWSNIPFAWLMLLFVLLLSLFLASHTGEFI